MIPELRVALLGQGFMGKAHSNAYCQAGHFFDLPYSIRRTLLCGRDTSSLAVMADRWGWEETSTDWRSALDRKDIDASISRCRITCTRPWRSPRREPARWSLREAARADCRRSRRHGRRGEARADDGVVQLPARAGHRLRAAVDSRGTARHHLSLRRAYRQQWGADLSRAGDVAHGSRHRPAPASATTCSTHLLDTALYLNGPDDAKASPPRTRSAELARSTTRSWRW